MHKRCTKFPQVIQHTTFSCLTSIEQTGHAHSMTDEFLEWIWVICVWLQMTSDSSFWQGFFILRYPFSRFSRLVFLCFRIRFSPYTFFKLLQAFVSTINKIAEKSKFRNCETFRPFTRVLDLVWYIFTVYVHMCAFLFPVILYLVFTTE